MRHSIRRVLPVLVLLGALVVAPDGASAATQPTAGVYVGTSLQIPGQHVIFAWNETPASNSQVDIETHPTTNEVVFYVDLGLEPTVSGDCAVTGTVIKTQITCALDPGEIANGVEFWGNDGNQLVYTTPESAVDTTPIWGYMRDGTSVEEIRTGHGNDVIDTVEGNTNDGGIVYMRGGKGVDTYVTATGDRSQDIADYDDVARPGSTISLDCVANDGHASFDGMLEDVGCAATGMDGLAGGPGDDTITGDAGSGTLFGNDGDDTMDGGPATDTLFGGNGDDELTGGPGNDTIFADASNSGEFNALGDGDDVIHLRDGTGHDDVHQCGGGTDSGQLDGPAVDNVTIPIPGDCEALERPSSDGKVSVMTFGVLPERVVFDPSASTAASDVTLSGNDATNTWTLTYTSTVPVTPVSPCATVGGAPAGTTRVECAVTNTQFDAGVELWLGNGNSTFTADANTVLEPLLIHPEDGTNVVTGGSGDDVLDGDTFETPGTLNTFRGGLGADTFVGGDGFDVADYSTHAGPGAAGKFVLSLDCVANDGGTMDGDKGDNIGCSANKVDAVTGSPVRDVIVGDAGVNRLDGGAGNDAITGGAAADVLLGGAGDDTIDAVDSLADTTIDCGADTDALTQDVGIDAHTGCETFSLPVVGGGGDGGGAGPGGGGNGGTGGGGAGGGGTTPPPTPDPNAGVPKGWTKGALVPAETRSYTFPAKFLKEGTTFEQVILALLLTAPEPPDLNIETKRISFSQLPKALQDDDVVPLQMVRIAIKSGAKAGSKDTVVFTDGAPQPVVEFQYYDPDLGAPQNSGCPADGMVKGNGGSRFNLYRYVETLPYDDAVRELNQRRCRIDGKPAVVRRRNVAVGGIEGVRNVKVGAQRVVTFTQVVPQQEELRIELAPEYYGGHLTLGVDDKGSVKKSLTKPLSRPGLTLASNTQVVGVHVLEASNGQFVPNVRVDLVDENGKIINAKTAANVTPSKRPLPIGYRDQHVVTNDVGFARLVFRATKVERLRVHAYVEDEQGPLVERWLTVPVYDRGATPLRTLAGTKWEKDGTFSLFEGVKVSDYRVAKQQDATAAKAALHHERVKATGIGLVDKLLEIFGALDAQPAGSPVAAGAPGVQAAVRVAETALTQNVPDHLKVQGALESSTGARVAVWDDGSPKEFTISGNAAPIVGAGAGNLVGAGAGNLVGTDAGSLVGAGAGNIVAAGAGNLTSKGEANLVGAGAGNLVAGAGAGIVAAGAGNIVGAGAGNRWKPGFRVDWLTMLRAANGYVPRAGGPTVQAVGDYRLKYVNDTPVLVGPDNQVPMGVVVHTQGRGVPVNFPGA